MSVFGRVTVALLWMVCLLPIQAGVVTLADCTGDSGPLPATAQTVWGDGGPLDAIFGNLVNPNCVDMVRILISDPTVFSATVSAPLDGTPSAIQPQMYLFDSQGLPVVGALPLAGAATFLFGPTDPGFYFLMISGVFPVDASTFIGRDPAFTDGGLQQPLFFQAFSFDPFTLLPVEDPPIHPIDSYQGFIETDLFTGPYEITFLDGVTAPNPEPGSAAMMLGGLAAVLALARKKRP